MPSLRLHKSRHQGTAPVTHESEARHQRPLPIPDDESAPYWQGARRRQLVIQRCGDCSFYIHYPKGRCPRCQAVNLTEFSVSGRGTVYSFSIVHVKLAPGFDPPYVVALVELDEQSGLRLVTNIVDSPIEAIFVGMPVEVVFEDVTPEITLPYFKPAATPEFKEQ